MNNAQANRVDNYQRKIARILDSVEEVQFYTKIGHAGVKEGYAELVEKLNKATAQAQELSEAMTLEEDEKVKKVGWLIYYTAGNIDALVHHGDIEEGALMRIRLELDKALATITRHRDALTKRAEA